LHWGCALPFIGAGDAVVGVKGVKEGVLMVGELRDEGDIPMLDARRRGVGWRRRDKAAARPGSTGMGWGMKLIGGPAWR
jgi:hypothetical protein